MSFTEESIYGLLPAYYRSRDAEQGLLLRALIDIIAGKAIDLENNVAQLYDNWFIGTCEEWVIPYIADLLGIQNFNSITGSSAVSQRAYVANTIGYRRRKGIAPLLEQLSNDIAGWRAHVVEFFQLLATTQYMNHIRLSHPVTPDLRSMNQLDLLNTAFDTIGHTVDVRHISDGLGKYNISNIGVFIWRLQSYEATLSDAAKVSCTSSPPGFYFTFSPLGLDLQLFNNPRTETTITHISEEINVPGLLRRRVLYDELEARRKAIADNTPINYNYFDDRNIGEAQPVFKIFSGDNIDPVPPQEIMICNLENCCIPPATATVVVDPVMGRFIFSDATVTKARVSYSYGFSGDTGSGTYNRQDTVPDNFKLDESTLGSSPDNPIWQAGVSKTIQPIAGESIFATIQEALDAWAGSDKTMGIISIMDSRLYLEDLNIVVTEGRQLLIIAADWPAVTLPGFLPGQQERLNGNIAADGLQPLVKGNITINSATTGSPDFEVKTGGQITLNGLLIQGKLTVAKGNLGALNISNCTLAPGSGGIEVSKDAADAGSNQWLKITMLQSICGQINLQDIGIDSIAIDTCIIDDENDWAVLANKSPLQLTCTTVFGKTHAKTITSDNSIFTDTVIIDRKQTGCMRFCFVPFVDYQTPPSTPRRFHCQPEFEINTQIANAKKSESLSALQEKNIRKSVFDSLVPSFTSVNYGHHAYGQLGINCPAQISAGADDGSEMGVFNFLKQPQRKANLLIALDEYLRLGLEAGLFYAT